MSKWTSGMDVPLTANSKHISRGFGSNGLELFQGDSYSMFWDSNTLGGASVTLNSNDHRCRWALASQELHFEPSREDYEERRWQCRITKPERLNSASLPRIRRVFGRECKCFHSRKLNPFYLVHMCCHYGLSPACPFIAKLACHTQNSPHQA